MNIKPKKSLGQNFLIDQNILNKICDIGQIQSTDIVLEVGPGTGNLTKKIIEKKPKKIFVIEKDENLCEHLEENYSNQIEIINKDVLKLDQNIFNEMKLIVFGNLPYNISTQILTSWLKLENINNHYKKFILMFQKEVADRIIAKYNTKYYGRLTIISNWKMNIRKIMDINPSLFYPKPKVKSTVLLLEPKLSYFKLKSSKNLEHVTNTFFNQRRKMIKKPLKFLFKNYNEIASNLNLNLNLRPQNLKVDEYLNICDIYEKLNN